MKYLPWAATLLVIASCQEPGSQIASLEKRIDSLEQKVQQSYRPGFGEFMSNIQAHHIKLWFAGQHENWELADFEVHEIMESLEDIRLYQADRKESGSTRMLDPALDSVNQSIAAKDLTAFVRQYKILTNTCNSCHRENEFGFNVVTIPESQPFSNQDFNPR